MHPYFNPTSREFIEDPYPFYRELREKEPIYRSPFGFYAVLRDSDVRTLLADRRYSRDVFKMTAGGAPNPMHRRPAALSTAGWLLFKDPPDHTRLRALVTKAFTAKRIQAMRPRIQATVDRFLDRMAKRDSADLVADFALRTPTTVIFDLLGIPDELRQALLDNIAGIVQLIDPAPMSLAEADRADAEHAAIVRILNQVFELRRREPADDLTTELVMAEEQGDRLSAQELVDNVILLFGAGFDTTSGLIGNALLALLRHPEELARLRADAALMPGAVEEFLRYDSSVQLANRVTLEETVLGDRTIPKGSMILGVLGSANRDEAVYSEPDRFDVARRDIRPVSFGGGIHHCIGAQLARLEIEIAIGSLIRRFPRLRLHDREKPVRRRSMTLRALSSLPVML
jgi:cytochrome P450